MIEDIGKEFQALKVQSGLHFSIDRAIAQVISDTNKLQAVVTIFERVIHLIKNWLLVLSASMFWRQSFITSRIQLPTTNFTTSFTNHPIFTNLKLPSFTDLKNKQ